MDSKRKHRILGILVITGLIVILLPFMQNSGDVTTKTAVLKEPPFPDQAVQVATETPKVTNPISDSEPQTPQADATEVKPVTNEMTQQPEDTISNTHSGDVAAIPLIHNPAVNLADDSVPTISTTPNNAQNIPTTTTKVSEKTPSKIYNVVEDDSAQPVVQRKILPNKKRANVSKLTPKLTSKIANKTTNNKTHRTPCAQTPLDDNGLFKLKNPVWVIQVGSFKNKANALRVVNNLRANGYRAFIQHISTADEEHTRVFVGPETKQASARDIATELETNMKLRGIIISYKPLSL